MKVSRKDLASIIATQMATVPSRKLAPAIAAYVIDNRLTKDLDSLLRDVMKARAVQSGITEATTTSAFPLTDTVRKEIKTLLKADTVVLNETIDKSTIGGVRIESNDMIVDLTVRNRLERLKTMSKLKEQA